MATDLNRDITTLNYPAIRHNHQATILNTYQIYNTRVTYLQWRSDLSPQKYSITLVFCVPHLLRAASVTRPADAADHFGRLH
ncbi:hypothetical protein AB1L30_21635 [Bremerella sp. JC817]|uniref:hypothetical protein n=1 Tax=Bremerella sp. JC817 TaxID=3231756 RepID=UPI00345A9DAD